jgi:plastocyanin
MLRLAMGAVFSSRLEGRTLVKRVVTILGVVALFLFGLSYVPQGMGLFGAQEKAMPTPRVTIDNFTFGPSSVTVSAGNTVTWINRDHVPHNVVSTDKLFKSKALDTDENFSYVFSKPGTYSYLCSIHPKMTGTVVVR